MSFSQISEKCPWKNGQDECTARTINVEYCEMYADCREDECAIWQMIQNTEEEKDA